MSDPTVRPGSPSPLGATLRPTGTNFAVVSAADGILLCLFDRDGNETRIPLPERDGEVWHGFVPGIGAGQAYGYQAIGPYEPRRGLRSNPAKLLPDPYARAIDGQVRFGPEVLGHSVADEDSASTLDSAAFMPRSLVVDTSLRIDRRAEAHSLVRRHSHLRGSCQRLHRDASRCSAGASRHVRRARP